MLKKTTLMIVGPTGSGKTGVAFALARRLGATVVNADKTFIYRGFPLATGQADSLEQHGVARELYQLLEPNAPPYPGDLYAEMVRNVSLCTRVGGRGVVIEGGSTTYVPAILELQRRQPFIDRVVGLLPPNEARMLDLGKMRLEKAFNEGLLDEVRTGLRKGQRDSLIMRTACVVVPLVQHLDGEINLSEAKRRILTLALDYAAAQMNAFAAYPEIHWIAHNPADPEATMASVVGT